MLRYWEVVDGNGKILAAGLGDSKHLQGRHNQQSYGSGGESKTVAKMLEKIEKLPVDEPFSEEDE